MTMFDFTVLTCPCLPRFCNLTHELAYQSALLSTPLVALRIFAALVSFPSWLQTIFTLLLVLPLLFMA
jgi:hypothetical protein